MRLLPPADPSTEYPRATAARVLSAAFNLATGLRLLVPDDTLGSSPGYRVIRTWLLGDVPLGVMLTVYGALIAYGCRWDRMPRLVDTATWLAALSWLLFAVGLTIANHSQLGTVAYSLPVALHCWAMWNTRARRAGLPIGRP